MTAKESLSRLVVTSLSLVVVGCGMNGFEASKMAFVAQTKVFECPAGNESPDCADVARGSLLQPADASGSIDSQGSGDGAFGRFPASDGGGASGSIPTGGSGVLGNLLTGGNGASGSIPTGGSGASGSVPTGGNSSAANLPTGGGGASAGFPTGGQSSSVPSMGHGGPTYTMNGSQLTVNPTRVCGPNVSTQAQAFLKRTTAGLTAVLFKEGSISTAAPSLVQVWDKPAEQSALMNQLRQNQPFTLNMNQPLTAGNYKLVLYDSQKQTAPYNYDWSKGGTAVAPMQDSVVHFLQPNARIEVAANGTVSSSESFNVVFSTQDDPECEGAQRIDPLVINMSDDQSSSLLMTSASSGVLFDILGETSSPVPHTPKMTAWIKSSDFMFLVLPKAGQVTGIDQMFGNHSKGPDNRIASHGFEALAKFDSNRDGVIDAKDPVFSHLRLWSDQNADGVSQSTELYTMSEKGLVSLDLHYDASFSETDQFGNTAQFKSRARSSKGKNYLLFDLWLNVQE